MIENLDKEISSVYVRKGINFFLSKEENKLLPELKQKIKDIIERYNCLVSTMLEKQHNGGNVNRQMLSSSLPQNIECLQQRLIESESICLQAI